MWFRRVPGVVAAVLCAATVCAHAEAMWRVEARDLASLQAQLITFTQERLGSAGLFVDQRGAWLSLSAPLPRADFFDVLAVWPLDDDTSSKVPLAFELHPRTHASAAASKPLKATLSVALSRDVWVAARRLRKGSAIACGDLEVQRRRLRNVPRQALALPCAVQLDAVMLRDVAAGDVIRTLDIGAAPAVVAGAPVSVSVAAGGISVSTKAIALADARVGDQIDVRLERPTRILRTRVTGPRSVQLLEGAP